MIVTLDAAAFNALAGPDSVRQQRVRRIMRPPNDSDETSWFLPWS